MREIDQLRPLTAGRLLAIWREGREQTQDVLERSLLTNAQVLAECCFFQGEAVFFRQGGRFGGADGAGDGTPAGAALRR